ncbi:hypothetical protein AB4Z29_02330 [Paenibacillus sp. 2TAB23]|uniref:hypothetical protein n=1 Tax=Paenibacillus sp. 2TAB23 TaxID=3233004 RepID=UPI003F9A38D7
MIIEIAGYLLGLAVWSVIRIKALVSQKKNKEAAVYGSLMGVSAVLGSLLLARMDLPSFTEPAKMILEPIGKMLLKQ